MKCRPLGPDELITVDGVYDLSMARYHGQPCDAPSISSSGLRKLWFPSPAHFYATSSVNPHRIIEDERPHFSLGRATHHLLFLGRKGFDAEFVVRPEKWSDWRTTASQEWRAAMVRAGLTVITEAELVAITGMARSLGAHPMVKAGILDGAVERSLIFRSRETGLWFKSRPDNITQSDGDFSDLKTTVSVTPAAIQRTIKAFQYHMQGGLVGMGAEAVLDVEMKSFTLVFVEKTEPHCVEMHTIPAEDILRGRLQCEAMMRVFADCVANDRWPGPGGGADDATELGLDEYERKRIDARLEDLKVSHPYRQTPLAA